MLIGLIIAGYDPVSSDDTVEVAETVEATDASKDISLTEDVTIGPPDANSTTVPNGKRPRSPSPVGAGLKLKLRKVSNNSWSVNVSN